MDPPDSVSVRPSTPSGRPRWIWAAVAVTILLVIGGIVAGVVVVTTRDSSVVTPTVTQTVVTPTPTVASFEEYILRDANVATDQCMKFAKLQFPNILQHTNCGSAGNWQYYPNDKVLAYVQSDYQFCVVAPIAGSNGSDVVGGNGGCKGVSLNANGTVSGPSDSNLCIVRRNAEFFWGSCSSPFAFQLQKV